MRRRQANAPPSVNHEVTTKTGLRLLDIVMAESPEMDEALWSLFGFRRFDSAPEAMAVFRSTVGA